MATTFETERLALRPMAAGDCVASLALLNDYDVARMLARVAHPYGPNDFAAWQETLACAWESGSAFVFAVLLRQGALIGCVGLEHRDAGAPIALGYWFGKPYWGQGYATEAGAAALAWLEAEHGPQSVDSSHFLDNPASGRVLEKLGFTPTGEIVPLASLARGQSELSRRMARAATSPSPGPAP